MDVFTDYNTLKEHISIREGIDKSVITIGKEYANKVTIFSPDLAGQELLVTYDKFNYTDNSDKRVILKGVYKIPEFMDLQAYETKLLGNYRAKEVPLARFLPFGKPIEGDDVGIDGLTARDYVCIHLGLPSSSKGWINELISEKLKLGL